MHNGTADDQVLIVGGGFGALAAAVALQKVSETCHSEISGSWVHTVAVACLLLHSWLVLPACLTLAALPKGFPLRCRSE